MNTDILAGQRPEQIFKQANEYHQAGRFQEAEASYLALLQTNPAHPEANYSMGVLALRQGKAATPYFLAALEADSASGKYWLGYIDALFQSGSLDEARQVLELAQQQGLQGREVDALALRLGCEKNQQCVGYEQPGGVQHVPSHRQIDELVALFGQGRLIEAEALARMMTERYPSHQFGWKALGAVLKQMGRTEDALLPMQKAAAQSPNDVEAQYNLGVTLQETGRLFEAESAYLQALRVDPGYADAHNNLGVTLQKQERLLDAEASYRNAVRIRPDYAVAHGNLGDVLKELGRFSDAEASYRRALQIKPDAADVHYRLGNLFKEQGRAQDAEAGYRRALQISPDYADALGHLGVVLREQGLLSDAEACYRRALQLKPDYVETHYNLGNLLKELGRFDEACACYQQAIQLKPDLADFHYNLGNVLLDLGRLSDAKAAFSQTISIRPDYAEAYCNLAGILLDEGDIARAEATCRQALQIKPDLAEAHCSLGNIYNKSDRLLQAESSYRQALKFNPDNTIAHSNLIFTLDLMMGYKPGMLYEERRRWNAVHAAHLHQQRAHANTPVPERRLRIGYVSADFKKHSAAYAFGAMLVDFDPEQFDVIAYSNSAREDDLTRFFEGSVTLWRKIVGLPDDAVADLIREDGIDILVDLSGHTAGNRLLVFARKPAPIQITAWGYAAGTGLTAMDVLFADPVVAPPEDKHLFSEQVVYLPSMIASFDMKASPAVNALPALSGRGITFGSFNRLVKSSNEVYKVWVRVLQALPDSRMVIKTQALDDAATRARVMAHFTDAGIDSSRILLLGKTSREEHLAAYGQIDLALDPFPHGGGVTALEGLVMGVPLVTLRWPTLAGRVSASIMTSMGLPDWIAESQDQYVDLAVKKAGDLQSLAALRGQLRSIFASSVIGDQKAYVQAVEQEYRRLWRDWCAKAK